MVAALRWVLRTAFALIVGILLVRAAVEYAPRLANVALFRQLVSAWDPKMQALVEKFGMAWSKDVRSIGLPAAAVVLILFRAMLDDFLSKFEPKPKPREPRPAAKPAAQAAAPAPAPAPQAAPPAQARGGTQVLQGSTVVNATGVPQPVQSVTGTAFLAERPNFDMVPKTIGRYEIEKELGQGAMGRVYKAHDPKIGRTVAIKTISAIGLGPEMEQYRQRFMLEAKSAGRLNHPSVVAVYDVADDEYGRPCLVLEFVEGTTLDKVISEGPLPLPKALDYVSQIARALDYAHGHGIVHRDVKPANIMLTGSGQAKLSDFGIAKIEGTTLTIAGQVLGTPAFMSPEQCQGHQIDYRSDIFSLGAVLYLLAAHTKPFPGETFTSVAYQVVHNDPLPVNQIDPKLPDELEKIIERAMAKAAQGRYASAARMADDIDALRAAMKAGPTAPGSSLPAS